ncbi:MAG: tRNA (cytosine(32)/uridine(32)-2'-O)-methyltransferase TrmJ [Kiritimatiellae bacterium]|nr:tRNA (cytosine(32)/uridine(32)-2'-O)-methyltransferase TrmJ [Kiritimatiellia bacterium]
MDRAALGNVKVVLVGTLYGGNVGSVCRAMANCGMSELRLVAPDPDITWEFARTMAVHATGILDSRRTFGTLREAVADCVAVAATSRRGGLFRRHFADVREAAPELADIARKGPVALVFGREDKGLLNEELLECTHVLRIPASPDYPSYNLAQSAVLVCNEFFRALSGGTVRNAELDSSPLATAALRSRMLDKLRSHLLSVGFMAEKDAERMMEGFGRVLSRGAMTEADMKLVMGAIQQSQWCLSHGRGEAAAESGGAR